MGQALNPTQIADSCCCILYFVGYFVTTAVCQRP